METFISIVLVVWAILNIALFFKVWTMTKHITEIKHFTDRSSRNYLLPSEVVIKEILKKSPDIENVLFDNLFYELYHTYNTNGNFPMVIERYKNLYKRANVAFPECFENITSYHRFTEKIIWRK